MELQLTRCRTTPIDGTLSSRTASRITSVLLVILTFALSGCAAYQHRLIEPAEAAGPIDRDGVAFTIEPLEYQAVEHRNRLALRIHNPTNDPITLLGERSYLVDPTGETRSLMGGTIAPGSHISLLLPPEVETVRPGPRVGVGVGVGGVFGSGRAGIGGYHSPWSHHPAYVRGTMPIWRWTTGDVRMHLVFERGDERYSHELHLDRIKVQ